ncbi:hypothetical protein [Candidatus Poriferisocius sp.]|uniref:hypothetical protein n=1 Tax=Candidatus Poriferisocius sp. TaxID=3101276 RepID=UPI003B013F7D
MKCVLPDGRNQLATKEDLTKFATKEDLRALEAKMATKEDLRALEAKMATKEDLAELATKDDLRILGAELRTEFWTEMTKQTRVFVMTMTAFMITIWGTMAAQFFV